MLRFMIGAVFVILSTTVPISAQVPSFQPVTDAMLEDPPPRKLAELAAYARWVGV